MSHFKWDDIDLNAGNIIIRTITSIDRSGLFARVSGIEDSIPIHYHCEEDAISDTGNTFTEDYPDEQDLMGAAAFSVGDSVLVMFRDTHNKEPVIIGFANGEVKKCGLRFKLKDKLGNILTDNYEVGVSFRLINENEEIINPAHYIAEYDSESEFWMISAKPSYSLPDRIWVEYSRTDKCQDIYTQYPLRKLESQKKKFADLIESSGEYEDTLDCYEYVIIHGATKAIVWDYVQNKLADDIPLDAGGFATFPCLRSAISEFITVAQPSSIDNLFNSALYCSTEDLDIVPCKSSGGGDDLACNYSTSCGEYERTSSQLEGGTGICEGLEIEAKYHIEMELKKRSSGTLMIGYGMDLQENDPYIYSSMTIAVKNSSGASSNSIDTTKNKIIDYTLVSTCSESPSFEYDVYENWVTSRDYSTITPWGTLIEYSLNTEGSKEFHNSTNTCPCDITQDRLHSGSSVFFSKYSEKGFFILIFHYYDIKEYIYGGSYSHLTCTGTPTLLSTNSLFSGRVLVGVCTEVLNGETANPYDYSRNTDFETAVLSMNESLLAGSHDFITF